MREAGRWVLTGVLIVGMLLFLSFQAEAKGGGDRLTSRTTIGFPWPWYEGVTERVVTDGTEQVTKTGGLRLTSPAWLILFGIVGAGYGIYRLRPRPTEGGS